MAEVDPLPGVRPHDGEDARRELAVEMFKRQVRAVGIGTDYDADIEYMEYALLAFANEWSALTPREAKCVLLALCFGDPSAQGSPDPDLEVAKAKLRRVEAFPDERSLTDG